MDVLFFILGLIVGSFLNCVIYRLEKGESFLKGRSYCPHCKHQLSRLDLIPVLSFLFLSGKCRYCHKRISWQYPLVELVTGILFFSVFLLRQNTLMGEFGRIYYLIVISFLIVIFVYDLKHYIIPDKVVYPAIGVVFLFKILNFGFVSDFGFRISDLYSAFAAAAFFAAIVFGSQGKWMGVGDIKLAFLMGLFLGWPNIAVALFFAFLSGAIIGAGLILAKKKKIKSEVPFGPFLVTGTLVALFWGQKIIELYLNLVYV